MSMYQVMLERAFVYAWLKAREEHGHERNGYWWWIAFGCLKSLEAMGLRNRINEIRTQVSSFLGDSQ